MNYRVENVCQASKPSLDDLSFRALSIIYFTLLKIEIKDI